MSLLLFWTSSSAGAGITGSGSADGYLPTFAGVGERVITGSGSADGLVALVSGAGNLAWTGSGGVSAPLPTVSGSTTPPPTTTIFLVRSVTIDDTARILQGNIDGGPIVRKDLIKDTIVKAVTIEGGATIASVN